MPFWTDHDERYGWTRIADPKSPAWRPEPLLVFVHGIMGDCLATWGETPEKLIEKAGVNLDAFTYHYPSKLHQKSSVEKAAEGLATALRGKFPNHRQYVFFVHSTGGLVIKEMLRSEEKEVLAEVRTPTADFRDLDFLTTRTRLIVNLDVPHAGGSKALTGPLYPFYELVIWPVVWVLKKLCPFLPLGHNDIPRQLRYRNKWVLELERVFVDYMIEADASKLLRPTSMEVFAADAKTIGEFPTEKVAGKTWAFRSDAETLRVRGLHGSFKLPAKNTDLFAEALSRRVLSWSLSPGRAVAEETYVRVYDLMRSVGGRDYLGQATVRETLSFTDDGGRRGNQAQIARALLAALRATGGEVRTLVITGDAGVGKSIALRLASRDLCRDYLLSDCAGLTLPLLIPLQRVKLTDVKVPKHRSPSDAADLWRVIVDDWCVFVNDWHPFEPGHPAEATRDWVMETLRSSESPTVLILDGVDEFLSRNLELSFPTFVAMLRHIQEANAANSKLTIVLGVRGTFSGAESLASAPGDIYRIRHLSGTEAEELRPGVLAWMDGIPARNEEVRDLLRTPLILGQLGGLFLARNPATVTKSEILQAVLETILRKTGFHQRTDESGAELGEDPWLDALSLIAWRFYTGSRAEMSLDLLNEEIIKSCGEWHGTGVQRADIAADSEWPERGFQLAADRDLLRILLNQTIFVPTGAQSWRIVHKEWEEYLAGRFLAKCLRFHIFREIADRPCLQTMFRIAGEHLLDVIVDEATVREVYQSSAANANGFIAGNFTAVLGNSRVCMDGDALALLLEREAELQGISRIVLLAGLGVRALREREPSLIQKLAPYLRRLAAQGRAGETIPVLASLAWCYLRALDEPDIGDWPGLTPGTAAQERELLLAIVADAGQGRPGRYKIEPGNRALQRAFLRIQALIAHDAFRPISLVHYLFYLCAAHHVDAAIHEVEQALPAILADGSEMHKKLKGMEMPVLLEIFSACNALYRSVRSTSP